MSEQNPFGVVHHSGESARRTDYLYRISLKCLVRNEKGEVLVVKESGRNWWDLPGGGMDHGESIKIAIAREMKEEVSLEGDFIYKIIAVDEPKYLTMHDFWQVRLVFEVTPKHMSFGVGEDGDEVAFKNPKLFENSALATERQIWSYYQLLG